MAIELQNKVLEWRHQHPSRGGQAQDAFSKGNHVVCVRYRHAPTLPRCSLRVTPRLFLLFLILSTPFAACSLRPLIGEEPEMVGQVSRRRIVAVDEYEAVTVRSPSVFVHDAEEKIGALTGRMHTKEHPLHLAFGPEDNNDVVFSSIADPMVDYVLRGGVACCIAYGQTGSGKTHTQSHLQLRAAQALLAEMPPGGQLFISFFENCGDANYDLLSPNQVTHVSL